VRRRFVFIANSKCASTSIEALLADAAEIVCSAPPRRKHMPWSAVRKQYAFLFEEAGQPVESFFRFGVMREPVDWFRSWFNYRSGDPRLPNALPAGTTLENFWRSEDWVKWRKDGQKHLQKQMFTDEDGQCHFDLIIPYDQLDQALPAVRQHLGLPIKGLPHRNASAGGVYRHDIPPALVEEINDFYREDFEFYSAVRDAFPAAVARLRAEPRKPARHDRRSAIKRKAGLAQPPLNYESVLIVTYGRSGSTLLQGLLNSIEGCVVRGENNNFCYGLFQAYEALTRAKREHHGPRTMAATNPWFGANAFNETRFLADAWQLVRAQLLGSTKNADPRCLGFKEIRYERVARLREFLDFLARVFPKPAFIFLTRDHAQVMKSGWWAKRDPQLVGRKLADFERELEEYARGKPWVFRVSYADMVERSERLRSLFGFLGAPYDADKVQQVLDTPHSYAPATAAKLQLSLERLDCTEIAQLTIDGVPGHVSIDEAPTLRGALVLQAESAANYRLIVRDAHGEKEVEWGLPSPKFAQRFRANRHAAHARFRASGLALGSGGRLSFVLVSAEGQEYEIARVVAAAPAEPARVP
jgi:hypothetical protein